MKCIFSSFSASLKLEYIEAGKNSGLCRSLPLGINSGESQVPALSAISRKSKFLASHCWYIRMCMQNVWFLLHICDNGNKRSLYALSPSMIIVSVIHVPQTLENIEFCHNVFLSRQLITHVSVLIIITVYSCPPNL